MSQTTLKQFRSALALLVAVFSTSAISIGQQLATEQVRNSFKPVSPASPSTPFAQEKPKPVKVAVYPMYDKLLRGGKCLIAVELQISEGWHINANPANPDFLVPTKLELKTKQKVKLTKLKYPKHHELMVEGFDEPYHVYDGKTFIYGLLEIDGSETAAAASLEFTVTFQGCNSQECLPPDNLTMKGKLSLTSSQSDLKKVNEDKFPKPKKKEAAGDSKPK